MTRNTNRIIIEKYPKKLFIKKFETKAPAMPSQLYVT